MKSSSYEIFNKYSLLLEELYFNTLHYYTLLIKLTATFSIIQQFLSSTRTFILIFKNISPHLNLT